MVNTVAYGAVEEVGAREARLLEREGVFLRGIVVAEEAPKVVVWNKFCLYVYVEGWGTRVARVLGVEHFNPQRVCGITKDCFRCSGMPRGGSGGGL